MGLLIKNIKTLAGIQPKGKLHLNGQDMKVLHQIENAWVHCHDDIISDFGKMSELPNEIMNKATHIIDATGKTVIPCWCDSHTHLVYAGTREGEFVDRINGLSYEEVAARGGGILNSAKKLADAGEDELFESAMQRLDEVICWGTGAIEIKSGYGLSTAAELKMLRVIKRIKAHSPIPVKATFLGAHAFPAEFKSDRRKYIDLIKNEMLPLIAKEQLADYCDVFCEENYFTREETIEILLAGKEYGLIPKVHANQLHRSGGVQAGVECGAISVDHLEFVDDEEIEALKNSSTVPTLLPGAAFFLGLPNPPAKKMIDAGLPVAIASDYNPGSSPSGNMNFMLSLACILFKMTPEEAINAATMNSACAMDLSHSHGSITQGKKANLIITKNISGYAYIPYSFANNHIEQVIINGKVYC